MIMITGSSGPQQTRSFSVLCCLLYLAVLAYFGDRGGIGRCTLRWRLIIAYKILCAAELVVEVGSSLARYGVPQRTGIRESPIRAQAVPLA